MKKIICLLLMQALVLINALPLLKQNTVHARPAAQTNAYLFGPERRAAFGPEIQATAPPLAARDPELRLFAAWLLSDSRPGMTFQKPLVKSRNALNPKLMQDEDDLIEMCARMKEEILKKLDDLGLELDKLARAMSHASGVADDVITSPALRRTFRSTMREVGARLAARGLAGSILHFLGPLGWILDILALITFADIFIENLIREDLMANDPNLTEDEARDKADELSDLLLHMQIDMQRALGGPVGGEALPAILHLLETQGEQRSCRIHNRRPPRHPPGRPRYFPPTGHSPDEISSGFPCAPGINNNGQPALPQSEPGSNGTSGSFDGGTITVTAPDPCKSGGR